MVSIKTAVLFSLFACVFGQTDWCNIPTCSLNQHIACNNSGLFYSSCVSPVAVNLTVNQTNLFLNLHNAYRNTVASGNLVGFLPARRMAKVTWNNQLAQFADLNTKQCAMNHDKCHNTATLKYSGQNLAMMGTTGTYTIEQVINKSLSMWFKEYQNANMDVINKFGTAPPNGGVVGHFTAIVTDRSTQIGCGISTYKVKSGSWTFNYYLVACNYASTNIVGWPVYKTGPIASGCTAGPDDTFLGLCKTSESIDPNSNSN